MDNYTAVRKNINKILRLTKKEFLMERLQTNEENGKGGYISELYSDIRKESIEYKLKNP